MKTLFFGILIFVFTLSSAQTTAPGITEGTSDNHEVQDVFDAILKRRSVRKFKPDAVPDSDIMRIIDAARMAPTAGNQQPWKFIIIKDRNIIDEIKDAGIEAALENFDNQNNNKSGREDFLKTVTTVYEDYCSAPVYIVVLTDNNSLYPDYNHFDGSLAAGNLLIAARALGYGTVFLTDSFSEKITKDILNIPDNFSRVCMTPVGIPYEWPASPPKKKLEEMIIREKF